MTGRRATGFLLAALAVAAFAAPAQASIGIESFATTSSSSQAGGHPDLTTSFSLAAPGQPEAAKNVIFNAPQGVFGNPNALTRCTAADYALQECPVNSQAGLITIRANYESDEEFLLGTAPIFDMVPQANETARFSLIVPTLGIPIAIPVAVRTADDYGLRFSVSEITQLIPLRSANLTIWGMPGLETHNSQRFQKGSPGEPAGCPGLEDTTCGGTNAQVSITVRPLINYPTTCSNQPLHTELDVQSYQEPDRLSHADSEYPPVTGCEQETFNPVLGASLTTNQTDAASGLNLSFKVPQTLGFTPSPSQAKSVIVSLPAGLTINPDAADGQTACSDLQANFHSEGPGECPDSAKIGTISLGTPALDGPLIGSIYIGEPKPGDQYRLFMVLSGFGINAKLIGSVQPDPATGRLTAFFEDLPQVPFDNFDIHLFASDRGLMATPISCTLYTATALFIPWNGRLANQISEQSFGLETGPSGAPCPGQVRPFDPRLVAGTTNPAAGAFSDFHLKLDREDGEQFLGRPQLQAAARVHRRPGRDRLLLGGGNRRRGEQPRPQRAGEPQLPGLEPGRDDQRRRGPRLTPVPRGRQDVPGGAVQGSAPVPGRGDAGDCRAVRLRRGRRAGRPPHRPADGAGDGGLRHRSEHHRRDPDPDALDPGEHRSGKVHDQPHQLLTRSPSTRRESATRER